MQTHVVRVLLIGLGLHSVVACSVPETAAAARKEPSQGERDFEHEQRVLEHRRERIQKEILRDLRALKESRSVASGSPERTSAPTAELATYQLLIFGGPSHEVYLGCLCEGRESESVFNFKGEFGSDLSENSIRNKFAPYGSNTADTSACNPTATRPPSVVASDGKSLGFLTLNTALKKRIATPSLADWLAWMCRS